MNGAPNPKISVVTVTYNSAKTLEDTLKSVASQSHDNIEYIVVDGGSTDGTLAMLERYKDTVTRVIAEPDDGIYDAMNKGMRAATGDFVGTLNSDDFFADTEVLADLARAITANPETDAFYGNLVFVSETDPTRITRRYFARRYKFWKARFGMMIPHPTFYVRPRLFDAHGFYEIGYRVAADFELMYRFFRCGVRFRHIDRTMVHMREGGVSTTGLAARLSQNHEIVDACRRNGTATNIVFVLSKIPFKLLSRVV